MWKNDPKIALVVCTRNRSGRLDMFFDAIRRLSFDCPWELAIVNGSTDDTGERLESFASTFQGQFTIITEPKLGLGLARNRGWRQTNAPIVAFTDDDCYPNPNYLTAIMAVFEDKDLGFCCGRTLLYDATDVPITINESTVEQNYNAGEFVDPSKIQGCNMIFRRQALVDIDGCDNELGAGMRFGSEDLDVVTRALAFGWKGKFDPRPLVYHHHGRKPGKDFMSIVKKYDADAGAFFIKCILFMPQRWQCLWYWLRRIRRQPFVSTVRQIKSGIYYLIYVCTSPRNRIRFAKRMRK
jgi:glycosyltransferase involved in cell wall biosynthesis